MKAAWCELTMLSYSYATLPGKQVKGSRKTSAVSSCLSGLMFHMTLEEFTLRSPVSWRPSLSPCHGTLHKYAFLHTSLAHYVMVSVTPGLQ